MGAGRPKLKLQVSDASLEQMNHLLYQGGLKRWQRDRLRSVKMAAKRTASYDGISVSLERARSAVQRWVRL